MDKIPELTNDELDSVCGGAEGVAGPGGSDLSDFLKWIFAQLHIPASSGGPIRK